MELTRKTLLPLWPLLEQSPFVLILSKLYWVILFCLDLILVLSQPSFPLVLMDLQGRSLNQEHHHHPTGYLLVMQISGLSLETQALFTKSETLEVGSSNNLCFLKCSRWFWMYTQVWEHLLSSEAFWSMIRAFRCDVCTVGDCIFQRWPQIYPLFHKPFLNPATPPSTVKSDYPLLESEQNSDLFVTNSIEWDWV